MSEKSAIHPYPKPSVSGYGILAHEDKEKKGWKTYSLKWLDLSKAIADIILEIEKPKENQNETI